MPDIEPDELDYDIPEVGEEPDFPIDVPLEPPPAPPEPDPRPV